MSNPPSKPLTLVVAAAPGGSAINVRIIGDVDLLAAADLARAEQQLAATRCPLVCVDLTGITFAGAALANFLFAVSAGLPGGASMLLCGPTPATRRIIELTFLDQLATVRDDIPADWASAPAIDLSASLPLTSVAA
jgi:anti-anti-sigma factor